MSSSTLVETVSINYDDFSESFLTCSTCLCPYDQGDHRPKLLSCSHTVCAHCLERIADLPQSQDSGSIRCPICRENIQIPRGGVPSLPPSFLVNQLIDLMQRQRRDVVPKCTAHPAEELLFCETCDTVFCPQCSDPTDVTNGCHNHTIVPFSIAIKRMSEIMLYKANQCVKNLNRASENVQREMGDLDKNVDRILDEVNASFQDLSQLLDRRRQEIIDTVRKTRDEKRRVLQEQLGIIQGEKAKVEQECNGLQYQVEVRNITRKIGDLNEKLDTTLTLIEPRENAFLKYDASAGEVLKAVKVTTEDLDDGTYYLKFRVPVAGTYRMEIKIFGRPIKTSPLKLVVSAHHNPIWQFGCRGSDTYQLRQPVRIACGPEGQIFILDTGNSRVSVLSSDGNFVRHITGEGLCQYSAVGLALISDPRDSKRVAGLLTLNWRTKSVTEWTTDGREIRSFTFSEFVEPIDLAVDSRGRILVADNGARKGISINYVTLLVNLMDM